MGEAVGGRGVNISGAELAMLLARQRTLKPAPEGDWRVVAAFALPREGEPGTGVMGDFYAVLEHPEAKP